MHAILVAFGSAGDVYPFLGLGTELRRRGHRVTMITAGYFEDLARRAGFDFAPFTSREDYLEVIGNPDLWHAQRSVPLLARRCVIPAVAVVYRLIAERYRPGETAVLASSLALGARVAQEKLGVPLTTIHLQPVVFRSRYQPPILPGLGWIRQLPVPLRPTLFRLLDFMVDGLYAGPLNEFRATLGLAPVKRVLDQWWHSPQSTLALFPKWFAMPQPDWPRQVRFLDFPLYDGGVLQPMPEGLQAWLDDGEAPVVYTSGSAMTTGAGFFAASAAASAALGRRGALLTRFAAQLPAVLPPRVRHVEYAPFSALLPRAAAFVHHGGIGTAAQALRAGVPQLVAPCSHDQFDNAARLERLGVSVTVPRAKYTADNVAAALRALLADSGLRARCLAQAAQFSGRDALADTVDVIEQGWRRLGDSTGAARDSVAA